MQLSKGKKTVYFLRRKIHAILCYMHAICKLINNFKFCTFNFYYAKENTQKYLMHLLKSQSVLFSKNLLKAYEIERVGIKEVSLLSFYFCNSRRYLNAEHQ